MIFIQLSLIFMTSTHPRHAQTPSRDCKTPPHTIKTHLRKPHFTVIWSHKISIWVGVCWSTRVARWCTHLPKILLPDHAPDLLCDHPGDGWPLPQPWVPAYLPTQWPPSPPPTCTTQHSYQHWTFIILHYTLIPNYFLDLLVDISMAQRCIWWPFSWLWLFTQ